MPCHAMLRAVRWTTAATWRTASGVWPVCRRGECSAHLSRASTAALCLCLWLCRGVRGAALGQVRLLPGALRGRDGGAAHPAARALLLLQPGAALRHHQRDGASGVHAAGRVRREDGPQRDHRALAHCVHDGGGRDGAAHQRRRPAARHLFLLHHAHLGALARRLQYFYTTGHCMFMLILCSCSYVHVHDMFTAAWVVNLHHYPYVTEPPPDWVRCLHLHEPPLHLLNEEQ